MSQQAYLPFETLPENVLHVVNNRVSVILSRLSLATEMTTANNIKAEIVHAKDAATLLVAQIAELCKVQESEIVVDLQDYGIDEDLLVVKVPEHVKTAIDKQVAEKYNLFRCEKCDKLHKSVESVIVDTKLVERDVVTGELVKCEVEYDVLCRDCRRKGK